MDADATEKFFGYVVAVYSMGQLIGSPALGYWTSRMGHIKAPMCVGLALMMIGNMGYLFMAPIQHIPKRYVLIVSRFAVGLGSGIWLFSVKIYT